MTPLPLHSVPHNWSIEGTKGMPSAPAPVPLYDSTPTSYQPTSPMLKILQQLQEDNRRLQHIVLDMQRQIDRNYALLSQHSVPLASNYTPIDPTKQLTVAGTLPQPAHQLAIAVEDEDWPPPPPPVTSDERAGQLNPDHRIVGVLEELKDSILKLELNRPASPSTPDYQQQYSNYQQSDSGSEFTNTAAPPLQPPRDYSPTGAQPRSQERSYRGPKPSIPDFTCDDPREFAGLRISLENILPMDEMEVQIPNLAGPPQIRRSPLYR